jgi:uroporphyrinogen-III decarboxylase
MTTVSLNFMPAFYNKHLGLVYGEAYYFDPRYRAEVDGAEMRFLFEVFGRYGVGSPEPVPPASVFIQPVDLILLTQGAALDCPEDATLQTRGTPWAGLSVAEIERIDASEAARHPIVERVLAQYRVLAERYGERADVFGLKGGTLCIHTPYTTAHQLYGEELFMLMVAEPEGARVVLGKVQEIIFTVFERIARELQAQPTHLQLGDCSASLLSPTVYRDVVLPVNLTLAEGFATVGYHSCGASSHLLGEFAKLPSLRGIQLGAGTDLRRAVELMPGAMMEPLIDPLLLRNGTEAEVAEGITEVLEATAEAAKTTLCAWSFDRETPLANVETMYEVVRERRSG